VEEELERRRDEIEAEVRHTLSLPLYLSPLTRTLAKLWIYKTVYFSQMWSQNTHTASVSDTDTHLFWSGGSGSAFGMRIRIQGGQKDPQK
jgi:hypothetical protein